MAFRAKYGLTLISKNIVKTLPDNTALADSVFIDSLNIEFQIYKSLTGAANKINLVIHNLPESLQTYLGKDSQIKLDIAYQDQPELKMGFVGSVISTQTIHTGAGVRTVVEAGDAYLQQKVAYTAKVVNNSTIGNVARDILLDDYKLDDVKVITGTVAGKDYLNKVVKNRSFNGYSKDELDTLASSNFFDWFIRDGVGYILPTSQVISEDSYVIQEGVNLLKKPVPFTSKGAKRDKDPEPFEGLKLEILLNPNLNIGDAVKVVLKDITQALKIKEITHVGVYEGKVWKTLVTGYYVEGLEVSS